MDIDDAQTSKHSHKNQKQSKNNRQQPFPKSPLHHKEAPAAASTVLVESNTGKTKDTRRGRI